MKHLCYLLAYYLDNVFALRFRLEGTIGDLPPGVSQTVYILYLHPKSPPY